MTPTVIITRSLRSVYSTIRRATLLLCAGGILSTSCVRTNIEKESADRVLVSVGDSTLTVADVRARIPSGLSEDDSLSLFSSIVDSWLEETLLLEMARENAVDMERIERLTADFRNRLIVNEYLQQLERTDPHSVSDKEVREVYEKEGKEVLTGSPLVKGAYIKLSKDADRLEDVRRWMRSSTKTALDNIEKRGLDGTIEFDRFTNRWVDWELIASRIPHPFGSEDFPKAGGDFELSDGRSTYFVHISELLPAGSPMPYEYAAPRIRESIKQRRRAAYGRELIGRLAEEARREGRLTTPGYDPTTHKIKEHFKNNEK